MRKFIFLFSLVLLSSCASTKYQICETAPESKNVVYVVEKGWHTAIVIPVRELHPQMKNYAKNFPGATYMMYGYGKKTFVTAPPKSISEYILGPVPGPAVVHVVGLNVAADKAYPDVTVKLSVSPESVKALSKFIWEDMEKTADGKPRVIAPSTDPAGIFIAAKSGYSLSHTCNKWTATALETSGLPVSSENVIFSGQVMRQVDEVAKTQCAD